MLDLGRSNPGVRLFRKGLDFLMKVLFKIEYGGPENIPERDALIVVANHTTFLDPFWIGLRFYRTLHYMAMAPLFKYSWSAKILRWFGAFPVKLENPESSTIKTALSILSRGEALVLFPEGGRSKGGRLTPFKDGAAKLALRTGATILPAVVLGGSRVWPPGMLLPRPGKVRVHYLKPIPREAFEHMSAGELTLHIQEVIKTELDSCLLTPPPIPLEFPQGK